MTGEGQGAQVTVIVIRESKKLKLTKNKSRRPRTMEVFSNPTKKSLCQPKARVGATKTPAHQT